MPKQLEKKKTTELEHRAIDRAIELSQEEKTTELGRRAIELSRPGSPSGAGEKVRRFAGSQPKPDPGDTQRVQWPTDLPVKLELVDKYQSKFTQAFKFKYRLRYQGIPLYGSSIIVDLDEDNKFLFANSSEVAQDEAVKKGFPDKNPKVTEKDLKDSISEYCLNLKKGEPISPEALKHCDVNPQLYYYFSHKLGEWRLVYVTNIKVMAPTGGEKSVGTSLELTDYMIDAHTGEIMLELSNLRTFC